MAKMIILVRHGEAEHNINDSHHIRDATLTAIGKAQCQELRNKFPSHEEVQLVVTSPLRRAIQTGALSFAPILRRAEIPFILLPLAQEISAMQCDIGLRREQLQTEISKLLMDTRVGIHEARIDYSLLQDGWNEKTGIYEASLKAVEQRAAYVRSWLWQRSENYIVLVTHGSFLHYLTEDWTGFAVQKGTAYANCEFRRFGFTEESNDLESHLVEVGSTREKKSRPPGIHATVLTGIEPVQIDAESTSSI